MRSWIEINKKTFYRNVEAVRKLVGKNIAIGIVLKGNAYGHGLKELSALAEHNREITWLLVATLDEALQLRQWGCKKEILTLAYCQHDLIEEAIHHNIIMSVTDKEVANIIACKAAHLETRARVHLKLDMGMNRLGIKPTDFPTAITRYPTLNIEGIFAHVGITNNPEEQIITNTIIKFNQICTTIDNPKQLMWHIGASGLLWSPEIQDLVRTGTVLYGSWKSELHQARIQQNIPHRITPIMTWKTIIIQIKNINQGDYVGYDYAFYATKAMRIAILPIGYADGYPRSLSQKGAVYVEKCYAPIIGLISMNLTAIDISEIPQAYMGSVVTLVGPEDKITPNAIAKLIATNPNDITTGINATIPRSICDETGVYENK